MQTLRLAVISLLIILPPAVLAAQEEASKPGQAAIASAHGMATEAGHEILEAGGNAFDAAVAVSAALAVVEPASSGIGGGGFWLLHRTEDDTTVMVDGRETAPAAAHRDMYLDKDGEVDRDRAINGPLAAGIPGAPAAWVHISREYGRLSLADALAPAIRLASEGFPVDEKYRQLMEWRKDAVARHPTAAGILLSDGEVPEIGHRIVQPELAETLRRLAEEGHDGFYAGELAGRMVEGVREAGGIWTRDDLAGYRVAEREPVRITSRGHELITAAPPSSGGIAIAQILNMLEPWNLAEMSRVQRIHLLSEAMRRAYRDRALYLGDPDFFDVPAEMLLSRDYAAGLRSTMRTDRATPSAMLAADPERASAESDNTSHFSLMDADGNLVSATLTINLPYGSGFMPPGTGVLLNNEMDDFAAAPGEPNAYGLIGFEANAIEPNKRMLSSMTPTLVFGPDRTAVLGTPGGSRIITMVLLGILDFMEGNEPESWVSMPRFHHQYLPDRISVEEGFLDDAEIKALEELGHEVEVRSRPWGNMQAVMWNRSTGEASAASDPRWDSGRAEVR